MRDAYRPRGAGSGKRVSTGAERRWTDVGLRCSRASAWATAAAQPVGDRPAFYQKVPSCSGGREVSCLAPLATWSRHGVPTCKRTRDAESRNSMSCCPSSVCTFTWLIS